MKEKKVTANPFYYVLKNRKGWIRIIEAFTAIILIASIALIVLDSGYVEKENISSEIYQIENSILKEIQLNNSLRTKILNTNPPVDYGDFPVLLKDKINDRIPPYLGCTAKICITSNTCLLDDYPEKDVYAQSVIISSDSIMYSPRQLKLFCWIKSKDFCIPDCSCASETCIGKTCEDSECGTICEGLLEPDCDGLTCGPDPVCGEECGPGCGVGETCESGSCVAQPVYWWDISTAVYLQEFSIATKEISSTGVFFKPDGTKMYTIGRDGDSVDEYDLSTVWDVSTAVYLHEVYVYVGTNEGTPTGVFFKPDGTKIYISGSDRDSVHEYDLSTAWDISTAIHLQEFSVAAKETSPQGVFFKPDGTKMYTIGTNGVSVDEYDLSTAWDISTAVYLQEFSVAAKETSPIGVFFKPDGTKMYTIGLNGDSVDEYDLG